MHEFKWRLPGARAPEAVLQIDARRGWFGQKTLQLGDQILFRRGRLEGIEARFGHPEQNTSFALTMVPVGESATWRAALFCGSEEIPEITGNPPPQSVHRPPILRVVVGSTYLLMLMAVVMLPSIVTILSTLYLRSDDRRVVFSVIKTQAEQDQLTISTRRLPMTLCGQTLTTHLTATGGKPPYRWTIADNGSPESLRLHDQTGVIEFTPARCRDYFLTVRVTDSSGSVTERPFAIVVREHQPEALDDPVIVDEHLPPAVLNQEYLYTLQAQGGQKPYEWKLRESSLPQGIELDSRSGTIHGVAHRARHWRLTIRVLDAAYRASQSIVPWILPFISTAICLLGYWNMRVWGVYAFAAAMVVEVGLWSAGIVPLDPLAFTLQIALLILGGLHLRAMS